MRSGLTALLLISAIASAQQQMGTAAKKLISVSWQDPVPSQMRDDPAAIDAAPFDGTSIFVPVSGPPGSKGQSLFQSAFSNRHWERAWFLPSIEELKSSRTARVRENFVRLNLNPGNVDWFDDAGWAEIVDHFRIAAWFAKQAGLKGIICDPEPYVKPFKPFDYRAAPPDKRPFSEYKAKTRERGRQVVRAVLDEYPDITVIFMMLGHIAAREDPWIGPDVLAAPVADEALAIHGYGLLIPFFDGWLDEMPPQMKIHDGDEKAYWYTTEAEFQAAAKRIRWDVAQLFSPANREKYLRQVRAAAAVFVDAFWQEQEERFAHPVRGAEVLSRNVSWALKNVDEYVWVYSERGRWWPPRPGVPNSRPLWDQLLPGASAALERARDPWTWDIEAALRATKDSPNALRNGEFDLGADSKGRPDGWIFWSKSGQSSGFEVEPHAALIRGVPSGVYIQDVAAKPGERWVVTARVQTQGAGVPYMQIRFRSQDRKWVGDSRWTKHLMPMFLPLPPAQPGGWREIRALITVPPGAAFIAVMVGVDAQRPGGDLLRVDRVWAAKVP